MIEPRSRRRGRWRTVLAILAIVVTVETVGWLWVCRRLDDGASALLRDAGWTVERKTSHWRGWPFAATVLLDDAVLRSGPDIIPPLVWHVPQLALHVAVIAPSHLSIVADGQQTLTVAADDPIPFSAAALEAAIDLSGQAVPRVTARDLSITLPGVPIRIASGTLDLDGDHWVASLAGIGFPGMTGRPIDPEIAALRLDGQITPPVQARATARASATDWRDRVGRLLLNMPDLHWGTLAASGRATIMLDGALQPTVDGTVSATGLTGALRQLADNGAITPATATAAGAMLAILAAPSGDGPLTLPITVTDGVVSVARFPLLRVVKLRWTD